MFVPHSMDSLAFAVACLPVELFSHKELTTSGLPGVRACESLEDDTSMRPNLEVF